MEQHRIPTIKHATGDIAVEQLPCNGWRISYNPDDEMFYVHDGEDNTVARHNALRNAHQWAREHTPR